MSYIGSGFVKQTTTVQKTSGEWGSTTTTLVLPVYDLDRFTKELRDVLRGAATDWLNEIIDIMKKDKMYQFDGIPDDWHYRVRFSEVTTTVNRVNGTLYNTNRFYHLIERDTRGGDRPIPPWGYSSRLWDWAERKGMFSGVNKLYKQRQIVYRIALKIQRTGTKGLQNTAMLFDERQPQLIASMQQAMAGLIGEL